MANKCLAILADVQNVLNRYIRVVLLFLVMTDLIHTLQIHFVCTGKNRDVCGAAVWLLVF